MPLLSQEALPVLYPDVTWARVRTPAKCPYCGGKANNQDAGPCRHYIATVAVGDALGLARGWPLVTREELVLQSHMEYTGGPRDRWVAFRIPARGR